MEKKYGHITDTSLVTVAKGKSFKEIGRQNKDMTETCRDCELRYICSDCRAYTHGNNFTGKPSKCKYDPYKRIWAE